MEIPNGPATVKGECDLKMSLASAGKTDQAEILKSGDLHEREDRYEEMAEILC